MAVPLITEINRRSISGNRTMIETRIVSGCRNTFRAGLGLSQRNVPVYLERTMHSVAKSDIPPETVTVFIDSLNANRLIRWKEEPLELVQVRYGVSVSDSIDLTKECCRLIKDNCIFLRATNEFAGLDPAPGRMKRLFAEFVIGGSMYYEEIPEQGILFLTGREKILNTAYVEAIFRLAKTYKFPIFLSPGGGLNTHLPQVLRHPPREEFILLLEDDVIVDSRIYTKAVDWIKHSVPDLVYGSLYNVFGGATKIPPDHFYSSQAIVIRSESIPLFLYWVDHYAEIPGSPPGWMDIILSRIAGKALNAAIHVYPESLVSHIGEISKWIP